MKHIEHTGEVKEHKKHKIGLTTVGSSMRPPLVPHARSPIITKSDQII